MQLLQQLPKDEHRDVMARLKEEQKRKLALLADQYEATIGEMMEKQTVRRDLEGSAQMLILICFFR